MVRAAHSLFDTEALRAELAGRFAGPAGFGAGRLHRSFINDVYQLQGDDGRLYYLRVGQAGWRTAAQTASEMAIIEAVAARGGSVARPVPLTTGGFVLDLEAPEAIRPAVLFQEAPGADLTYAGDEGPANAELSGRAAGALHLAMDGLPAFPERPGWLQAEVLDEPVAGIAPLMSADGALVLERTAGRLREFLADAPDLNLGLCHGDLNSSNIHFRDGRATAIDFDCAAWGWRANDISAFARGVTLGRHPGAEASALITGFLRGYQAARPIPPADLAALPAFLLIQRLADGLAAWAPILDKTPDWLIGPPGRCGARGARPWSLAIQVSGFW